MKTEDMICELRRLEEAHKADFVGTGQPNWAGMCHDVANRLEALLKAQEPMKPKYVEFEDWGMTWEKHEVATCGKCGALLGDALYCPICGKPVKWE